MAALAARLPWGRPSFFVACRLRSSLAPEQKPSRRARIFAFANAGFKLTSLVFPTQGATKNDGLLQGRLTNLEKRVASGFSLCLLPITRTGGAWKP
jgi:hypothetical protein